MKDTNKELIELMAAHNIGYKQLGKILKSSESYVRGYTCESTSTRHRNFPEIKLQYLKARIRQMVTHTKIKEDKAENP